MSQHLIETLIDQYLSAPTEHEWHHELVRRHHVLPLMWDWTAVFALEPSGQVVTIDYEAESQHEPVADERLRNMALKQGSRKFAALEQLLPMRPADAKTCPMCNGTGSCDELPEQLRDRIVCWCGGMGWIP